MTEPRKWKPVGVRRCPDCGGLKGTQSKRCRKCFAAEMSRRYTGLQPNDPRRIYQ